MERLVVKLVESEGELEAAYGVRIRVFVQEQEVPADEEVDDLDRGAIHAIALLDGKAVGTGRLIISGAGEARIGRMAVDLELRRRSIGGRILGVLESAAKQRGASQATLNAQTYVKAFYASHGYVEEGDVFLEVGIEHVQMRKRL